MSGWPWEPLPNNPGLGAWRIAEGIGSPVRQRSMVHPEQGSSSEQGNGIDLPSIGVQLRMAVGPAQ